MNNHLLGLGGSLIIGMNAMIGASIFSLPSTLMVDVGPLSIVAYAVATVLVVAMAYALARVALRAQKSGAFFEYTRLWAGDIGGTITTVIYIGGLTVALGLLAQVTSSYLSVYIPSIHNDVSATVLILTVALLVCCGTHANRIGQIILLSLTIIPMVIIAGLALSNASLSRLVPFAPHGWSTLIPALKAVVFGLFGFEAIPALARHMHNPSKTVGPAIVLSVLAVGTLYCAFITAIILGIPINLFTHATIPLSDVLTQQFPNYPWIVSGVRISIIITIIGTIHAMLWAISELVMNIWHQIFQKDLSLYTATTVCSTTIIGVIWGIKSIDIFFSITALLITLAYAASMIPLITVYRRSLHDRYAGIAGLGAATIIIFCAIEGLFKHLSGSLF